MEINKKINKGDLFVVATPIGNMEDITLRALKILEKVDIIAAEDTRHTGKLLNHYNIKKKLVSYHEHNETLRSTYLLERLNNGESIAIVTDAGTPSVSDPGYRLIKKAIESGINIIPIPGVSAVTTAISAAGLPTDSFIFAGFLSRKKAKRIRQLKALGMEHSTIILYESPRRIINLMEDITGVMGNRYGVLAREMTKIHEEFIRGTMSEISYTLKERPSIKGECTLLVTGFLPTVQKKTHIDESVRDEIKQKLYECIKASPLFKKDKNKHYNIINESKEIKFRNNNLQIDVNEFVNSLF